MPLTFETIPGLAGNPLVLARGDHDVVATGPCLALATWIPEFRPIAGPAPNTIFFALWRIQWLGLAILRPAPGLPARLLVGCMVNVQRIGVAIEACIAGGLNLTPTSASVARKLLRRKAAAIFTNTPAPFLVQAADLYGMVLPPLPPAPPMGAALAGAAPCNSTSGAAATIDLLVGADGTFMPWAHAEPILFPRFDILERGAGSGFDFLFETWAQLLTAALPVAVAGAIPGLTMAQQVLKRMEAHLPDEMLASPMEAGFARFAHAEAFASPLALNATNALVALQHTEVLLAAITVDTPGSEIIRMTGVLIQAMLGNVPVTLSNVALVESRLVADQLLARMMQPDAVALPPSDRITLLVTEYSAAEERRMAAPRSLGETETLVGGYTRQYDQALRTKLNSTAFLQTSARLSTLFATGTHARMD